MMAPRMAVATSWPSSPLSPSRVELISDLLINLTCGLELLKLALDGVAPLSVCTGFIRFFNLLLVQLNVVLLEVPLAEWRSVDQHDGVFHERLCAHKLVVGGVVGAVEKTCLGSHAL